MFVFAVAIMFVAELELLFLFVSELPINCYLIRWNDRKPFNLVLAERSLLFMDLLVVLLRLLLIEECLDYEEDTFCYVDLDMCEMDETRRLWLLLLFICSDLNRFTFPNRELEAICFFLCFFLFLLFMKFPAIELYRLKFRFSILLLLIYNEFCYCSFCFAYLHSSSLYSSSYCFYFYSSSSISSISCMVMDSMFLND